MDATAQALTAMFKENTGAHFLDSGRAYGRHWQENQKVDDFTARPSAAMQCHLDRKHCLWIDFTVDAFHFLNSRVDYCKDAQALDAEWREYCRRHRSSGYPELMLDFIEVQGGRCPLGGESPTIVNTYNGDSALSQVLQFVTWHDPQAYESYVLLQVHNGCDVRGGYTRPKVFRVFEPESLFDDNRAIIGCQGCNAHWMFDSLSWTPCQEHLLPLEEYPTCAKRQEEAGHVWVEPDTHNAHCPICGDILAAYGWD